MNVLLFLYLLAMAPKLLWDKVTKGKRHPGFLQRLGFNLPKPNQNPLLWIHAVSVGEVKAVQPLFQHLRKKDLFILITTTSATGQAEARRSLSEADAFAYLPLDFSWVVHRFVKHFNPRQFILVESDFWPNLLSALKRNNTHIALVSGKLSARSAKRLSFFPSFAKRLFSHFDALCVQNEEHKQRFLPHCDLYRLHITGNLKFDLTPQPTQPLSFPQPAITISCTHAPEEELLLDLLSDTPYFLLLAPRHPERFEEVAALLAKKKIPFSRWSSPQKQGKVLLVDTMGQLPTCYLHSRLAIVAGSYVSHIGGHNVLEPCLYGTPVLFGPHIFGQKELATRAIESGAGLCTPPDKLLQTIEEFFANPAQEKAMRKAALEVIEKSRGSTLRTLEVINRLCINHLPC